MISLPKHNLRRAQHRMKQLADRSRTDRVFQIGDWVWLKLQAYRQTSVQHRSNHKLSPKYFGPFQIRDRVGQVAYTLQLPPSAQIHPTVHVSQLKLFRGVLPKSPYIPPWLQDTPVDTPSVPEAILARRLVKRQNKAAVQYLVQWQGLNSDQATWEFADVFEAKYPDFQP